MKYFTKAQIEEIRKQLATLGVRDTDLPNAHELDGDELVAIVQDGINKKVGVRTLIHDYLPDDIADGQDGASAYDIWRSQPGNYNKSVQEFLDSLKGEKGRDGANGTNGTNGTNGINGTSAGFGTPHAYVSTDSSGEPKIEIETSGPDTAKVFDFTFKNFVNSGSSYEPKIATQSQLGLIKVGGGLGITPDGTLSVLDQFSLQAATKDNLGGIRIGHQKVGSDDYPIQLDSSNKAYVVVPGGGEGGVSLLRSLTDVNHNDEKVLRSNGADVQNGDVLAYNSNLNMWVAAVVQGDGTSVDGYIGTTPVRTEYEPQDLTGIKSFKLTTENSLVDWDTTNSAWHFHGNLYADGWVAAGGIGTGGSGGSYSAGTGIDITSGVISLKTATTSALGGVKVDGTTITIDNGVISAVGGGDSGTSVRVSDLSSDGDSIATITIGGTDYDIKNGIEWGTYNDISKTVGLTLGGQQYVLCVNGYAAGDGVSSESDPVFTSSAAYGISAADITNWNSKTSNVGTITGIKMNGSSKGTSGVVDLGTVLTAHQTIYTLTLSAGSFTAKTWNPATSAVSVNIPTTLDHIGDGSLRKLSDYVTVTGVQDIIGPKTFKTNDVTLDQVDLVPAANNTCSVGSSSKRFADIYGVDENLSGDLTLSATSEIILGPVHISYDSSSKALHISGTDAGSTIGLYCDGFVAAGGIA